MDRPANQRWFQMALLFAIVYPVVGIAFAAHLGYEHFRLRNPPLRAASHVSVAVALGAFALAVWINVHAHASSHQSPLAPLALVVFPAVTGVPAFVVALAAASVLARTRWRNP